MLGVTSFYKSSKMPPNARPKRTSNPAVTTSTLPKKIKVKTPSKTESNILHLKPLVATNARRSPRLASRVKINLQKLPATENKSPSRIMVEGTGVDGEEDGVVMGVKPLEHKQESSESDEEVERLGLSDYEKRRLENISKNAEFFASLNIFQAKENLAILSPQQQKPKPLQRGIKGGRKAATPPPPRTPSLRLQNKSPEGTELPERFKEPPLYSMYLPGPSAHERKPSGPITMAATNVKKMERIKEGSDFIEGLSRLAKAHTSSHVVDEMDLERFAKRLQRMEMKESYVAKVVPDRIFSVAVHPSCEKSIVCAGDKWGKVGLWDIHSTAGDDGVFLFEPHSRPVNCLRFAPQDSAKLYSISYDGTIRKGDFNKAVFEEVFATDEDYDRWTNHFDFLSSDDATLLVTQNEGAGYIAVIDTRARGVSGESVYRIHSSRARSVSVHPTMRSYFVTASTDGTAALWDLRKMKRTGLNQPVATMQHGKTVSSAFFSPLNGSKILTTSVDDKISIFDTESAKDGRLTGTKMSLWLSHNNHTGRWLTPFQAAWHPQRDDAFVVGSMEQPRRIEVCHASGKLVHSFFDDNLASVCSVNAFHPTRDFIVGCNSSGRLHVFMS